MMLVPMSLFKVTDLCEEVEDFRICQFYQKGAYKAARANQQDPNYRGI